MINATDCIFFQVILAQNSSDDEDMDLLQMTEEITVQ